MQTSSMLVLLAAALALNSAPRALSETQRLSRAALEDKIRGGWAGQMIGVSYGAPTEFRSNGKINETRIEVVTGDGGELDSPG